MLVAALPVYVDNVLRKQSRLVVVFASAHYAAKAWPCMVTPVEAEAHFMRDHDGRAAVPGAAADVGRGSRYVRAARPNSMLSELPTTKKAKRDEAREADAEQHYDGPVLEWERGSQHQEHSRDGADYGDPSPQRAYVTQTHVEWRAPFGDPDIGMVGTSRPYLSNGQVHLTPVGSCTIVRQ
jgi:hypothetical protein